MVDNNYKVLICNSNELFFSLKDTWKNFENEINHSNITSSYDWLSIWWQTFQKKEDSQFGYKKQLLILFLYKNDKLISIIPLLKLFRKKYFVNISYIEFLGQQWCGMFSDIISKQLSNEDFSFLFNWLYKNKKFDLLNLSYIPDYTYTFNLNDKLINILSACPTLNLNDYEGFDSFCNKTYSKNLKQNIRTAFNYMKKNEMKYDFIIENINNSNFNEIIRLSKMKLIDGKHSIYLDNDKLNFIKEICKIFKSDILFIKINNINVAYRLNLYYNNDKYCIDASYDRNFRKIELGTLSVHESIKDSFQKKLNNHCEGTGIDFYKMKFIKNVNKIYSYSKSGNSFLSKILFYKFKRSLIKIEKNFIVELNERLGKD